MIISLYYCSQDELSHVEEIYSTSDDFVLVVPEPHGQDSHMAQNQGTTFWQSPKVFYKVNLKHSLCFPDDATKF